MKGLTSLLSKDSCTFPSHWIDPEEKKTKEWGLAVAKAIWTYQANGATIDYEELRNFAEGTQPNSIYMDILCPKDAKGNRRNYYNISWRVISLLPRYENCTLGIFDKIEHEVQAEASDPYSDDRKDNVRWFLWDQMKRKQYHDEVAKMLGLQEHEFQPSNSEELDIFMELAFKLKDEIASQAMITQNLSDSDWEEIKIMIFRDFFRYGISVVKDEVNPHSNKIYARYIDPETFIGQKTKSRDGHEMEFGAHVEWMTILDIKQAIPEGTITEEEFKVISEKFNQFNNISTTQYNNNEDRFGSFAYDSFKVPVLCYERISWDRTVMVAKTTKKGNQIIDKKRHDYKGGSDKEEVIRSDMKTRYKGKWIIDTNHIFDYGLDTFIPKEGFKNVSLSYTMYKVSNLSLVGQAISTINMMNLAWFKFQNAWGKARSKGVAIETGMLNNLSLNGKKFPAEKALKILMETGNLLYKKTGAGNRQRNGMTLPITELEGGVGPIQREFIETVGMCEQQLNSITGLSEALLGSDPNPQSLVGTTQLAVIQSNNRLQPMYKGYLSIKKRICKNFIGRAQTIARTDPEKLKAYYPVLGSAKMNVLELAADMSKSSYDLRFEAKPTDEVKGFIRKNIDTAIQAQTIDIVDAIEIEDFLERGNLKYAKRLLIHKQKIKSQQAAESAAQNAQMNQDMQAQSLEQGHQQKMEILGAEQQGKLQIQQSLKEFEERQAMRDGELQKQIQQLIGAQQMAVTRLKGEIELEKADKQAEAGGKE